MFSFRSSFLIFLFTLSITPVAFALSGENINTEDGSGFSIEDETKKKEQEKIMDDMNVFLIDTYKLKLDAILQRLERGIEIAAEGDASTTYILYKKVSDEVARKVEKINNGTVSPNRRKVLLAVFEYIRTQIEEKMKILSNQSKKE